MKDFTEATFAVEDFMLDVTLGTGMKYTSFGYSDIGKVREQNEDNFLVDDEHRVYAVADGLGGLPMGDIASQIAISTLADAVLQIRTGSEADYAKIVQRINRRVYEKGKEIGSEAGIGTTLTALFIKDNQYTIYHVGDCAVLLWKDGTLEQVTAEHTMEAELRERLGVGKDSYLPEYLSHTLTRCIGQHHEVEPQILQGELQGNERLLICSDGITKVIEEHALERRLAKAESPEKFVRDIIALANRRGGPDNATAIALFIDA